MKKIFAVLVMAVAGISMVAAQGFSVTLEGKEVANGDTCHVSSPLNPMDFEMSQFGYLTITNTSTNPITFQTTVTPLVLSEGYSFQFCSGVCFDITDIPVLPQGDPIQPGDVYGDGDMEGTDLQYNLPGTWFDWETFTCVVDPSTPMEPGLAKLEFTDLTNGGTFTLYVWMEPYWANVANEDLNRMEIAAYPNPATEEVTFNLGNVKAGSKLVLRDMSGRTVKAVEAETEMSMDVEGLSAGVYFYSLEENGKAVATRKLVVR